MNQISTIVLLVCAVVMGSESLSCWFCTDATNDQQCLSEGFEVACEHDQICFTEQRIENSNYRRTSSCKQRDACILLANEAHERCPILENPEFNCFGHDCTPRLCTSCCWWEDFCNKPSFVSQPSDGIKEHKVKAAMLIVLPQN